MFLFSSMVALCRRPAQFDMPKPREWDKLTANYEREANQPA